MRLLFSAVFAATLALISQATFAATLTLAPGETVTIRPNVSTTVMCEAAGGTLPDCTAAISSFESRYNTCKRSFPASTCFNNEWPVFKSRHPDCVVEGFDACIKTCGESFPGTTCYNNCR